MDLLKEHNFAAVFMNDKEKKGFKMKKLVLFLPVALALLLSSSMCSNDYEELKDGFIFQNVSNDTVCIVVSHEYPDTLYPFEPDVTYDYILPNRNVRIGEYSLRSWFDKSSVLQVFVYDKKVPLGVFLRKHHAELARFELTKELLRNQKWIVTYSPTPATQPENP